MIIKRPGPPKGPRIPAAALTDFDRRKHYHELVCGHTTDLDTDTMMRGQESPRDKLWCDTCSKWRKPKPDKKRPELPREPLF